MDKDEWVVGLLKQGTEEAFKYIYDQYYVLLCHIAHEYVQDRFLAETLVSDVIFHLWEVHDTLDIKTSLRNYLLRSVRNRSLDYLRSKHEKTEVAVSSCWEGEDVSFPYLIDEQSPLGVLLEKELETEINQVLQHLPPETRIVFRKSRFEKKKHAEIAQELGISVSTVKYHIKNALAKLTVALENYLVTWLVFFLLFSEK